ncbi:glycogen/starch synthase [bacterium]|nr:glycogen/starch synthase [bacterium]
MAFTKHICMLAAENDTVPGGKVGGIGDVVRDIPQALANDNTFVTVVMPAYGAFHELPDTVPVGAYNTFFRGVSERIELFEIYPKRDKNVRYLLLHHPLFAAGGKGSIYCDDDADQPFATDANKFALFSMAALSAITSHHIAPIDVLHLHDWHAALALPLIRFDHAFEALRGIRTVFSIHNIALQGIRPFTGHESSFQAWYPHMHYDPMLLADPRWAHCVNPVVGAIRMADKVHTVSPTYAKEILQANDPARGFHGGEGLESDLQQAAQQGRLVGIINGTHYPATTADTAITQVAQRLSWQKFNEVLAAEVLRLIAGRQQMRGIDYVTHQRILQLCSRQRPEHILTSVGRLTEQKVALLLKTDSRGRIALDSLLESLAGRGLFILLGSGDSALERQCEQIAARHENLLFINQYSVKLSDLLFSNGDLFVMPSSFEPCGISQMLAMKDGQPCLAHAVGGLRDTITDDVDGFLFSGNSMEMQVQSMLKRLDEVLHLRKENPANFTRIAAAARKKRFDWSASASRYQSELYS